MSARLMRLACALALAFALVCAPGAWAVEGDEGQAGVAAASGDGAVDGESAANGEPADGATDDAPESAGEAGQGDEVDPANAIDPQLLPDSSFIYDTSIVDLAQADSYFDNQTVRVTGEVVGDRRASLGDAENCWITLTEPVFGENSTVEVYMSNEQASRIDTYGAYGRVGTILSVQGTFHLVCAEHEGGKRRPCRLRHGVGSRPCGAVRFRPAELPAGHRVRGHWRAYDGSLGHSQRTGEVACKKKTASWARS